MSSALKERIQEEAAENDSFKAAEKEGLIPNDNEYARRVFGLGFRCALHYCRFSESSDTE